MTTNYKNTSVDFLELFFELFRHNSSCRKHLTAYIIFRHCSLHLSITRHHEILHNSPHSGFGFGRHGLRVSRKMMPTMAPINFLRFGDCDQTPRRSDRHGYRRKLFWNVSKHATTATSILSANCNFRFSVDD